MPRLASLVADDEIMLAMVSDDDFTWGLARILDGCERILHGEFNDYPESALYMIGTIDEAKAKSQAPKKTDASTPKSVVLSSPPVKPNAKVEHAAATHES